MKKYINGTDMRTRNFYQVLDLIRSEGPVTRKELEKKTGFSWGAVSNITGELCKKGFIVEEKYTDTVSPGRTPFYLRINGNDNFILGFDINITGFTVKVADVCGDVKAELKENPSFSSAEELKEAIFGFFEKGLMLASGKNILAVGIALQGTVDSKRGISVSFPLLADWKDVPLKSMLEEKYSVPVFIEHDPECLLYAAGRSGNITDALLFRIDKGIGMAAMVDGRLFGKAGMFEAGHLTAVKPDGNEDTFENLATLSALTDGKNTLKKAQNGGESEKEEVMTAVKYLSKAISIGAGLLNINTVIVCGDFTDFGEENFRLLKAETEKTLKKEINLTKADVSSASDGAVIMATDRFIETISSLEE